MGHRESHRARREQNHSASRRPKRKGPSGRRREAFPDAGKRSSSNLPNNPAASASRDSMSLPNRAKPLPSKPPNFVSCFPSAATRRRFAMFFRSNHATPCIAAALAIGPEGGWTDDELSAARASGFQEASLGQTNPSHRNGRNLSPLPRSISPSHLIKMREAQSFGGSQATPSPPDSNLTLMTGELGNPSTAPRKCNLAPSITAVL